MKLNQWQIVGLILIVAAMAFYGWRQYASKPGTPATVNSK